MARIARDVALGQQGVRRDDAPFQGQGEQERARRADRVALVRHADLAERHPQPMAEGGEQVGLPGPALPAAAQHLAAQRPSTVSTVACGMRLNRHPRAESAGARVPANPSRRSHGWPWKRPQSAIALCPRAPHSVATQASSSGCRRPRAARYSGIWARYAVRDGM